jgi:hypothetical protein
MKTIKIIETADELINLMKGKSDGKYLIFKKLQIGEIKDSYVEILDSKEYQLAPGITLRSLFFAMANHLNLNVTEQKLRS